MTTAEWAKTLGIADTIVAPPVPDYHEACATSAEVIAKRVLVLHCVAAVGCHVDPLPIVTWLKEQHLWADASPLEQAFLLASSPSDQQRIDAQWCQEAEWTLLWTIKKTDTLGLPTSLCDTARLVDEIIPPLGTDVTPFVETAHLRHPGELLAEGERSDNLWCYAHAARRRGSPLPDDLNWCVLYQRRYAFEWLDAVDQWDDVSCDA